MEINFWVESEADGILYPGIVDTIKLPDAVDEVERTVVITIPEEVISRPDMEIVLRLGKANLLITNKDKDKDKDKEDEGTK
jgi:hypothetical protein